MRIAHITRDYPPHVRGGVSIAVEGLTLAYASTGHTCTVISFEDWRPFKKAANNTPAALRGHGDLKVLSVSSVTHLEGATDHVSRFTPDLLLCHDALLWDYTASLAVDLDIPAAFFVHVMHPWQDALRGLEEPTASTRAHHLAIHEADRIFCPSECVRDSLAQSHPRDADRFVHTPLGITTLPTAHARSAPTESPTVLIPGRLGDLKGTDLLLDVIPLITSQHPSVTFAFAGGVPGNARSERRWRKKLARLGPSVEVRGWLNARQLSQAFEEATLVLLPSRCETFGLAAAEALAHGRAVVANGIPAHREILLDGKCGMLTDDGSPEALARATCDLLDDPEKRKRLETRGWLTARHRLLWEHSLPFHAHALAFFEGDSPRPGVD
jgi:glycosyltransferase involved in cell wall biosynthesis